MPAALAEPETGWTAGGYHGFSLDHGTWPAISSAGNVLAGATPTSWSARSRRTGRRCSERIGRARWRAGETPPPGARHRSAAEKVPLTPFLLLGSAVAPS